MDNDEVRRITRKRKSFARRIFINIIIMGIIVNVIIVSGSFFIMRSSLKDELSRSSKAYAVAAASQLDGDVFDAIGEGDEESEEFAQIYDSLTPYLEAEQVTYIYSMRMVDNELYFVVDTDPEDPAALLEHYDETVPGMREVFSTGKPSADKDITTDEWGSFISGYAPIMNANDEVVGVVGVDFDASSIKEKISAFLKRIIVSGIFCEVIAALIGIVLYKSLKKRLKLLNDKLADVVYNDGNLNQKVEIHTGDEFEDIADNLNAMLEQTRGVVSNVMVCSGRIHNVAANVDETMGEARDKVQIINDYMEEMSEGIELTVESLENIRSMMGEVAASVEDVTCKSSEGTRVATEISSNSEEMTQNALSAQQAILEQIGDIRENLEVQLEKARSAEKIQSFTADILNIADETQMLSLNASIEAARAGEAGRGFSVVAESIGKLAVSSGEAAENIQQVSTQVMEVVEDLSALSRHIVGFIEHELLPQFEELTQSGERYAEFAEMISGIMTQFEEKMGLVDSAVNEVQEAVEKVADASASNQEHILEISDYAGKLNQQMGHTVDMSQMNKEQADNLSKVVERFTVE